MKTTKIWLLSKLRREDFATNPFKTFIFFTTCPHCLDEAWIWKNIEDFDVDLKTKAKCDRCFKKFIGIYEER